MNLAFLMTVVTSHVMEIVAVPLMINVGKIKGIVILIINANLD